MGDRDVITKACNAIMRQVEEECGGDYYTLLNKLKFVESYDRAGVEEQAKISAKLLTISRVSLAIARVLTGGRPEMHGRNARRETLEISKREKRQDQLDGAE